MHNIYIYVIISSIIIILITVYFINKNKIKSNFSVINTSGGSVSDTLNELDFMQNAKTMPSWNISDSQKTIINSMLNIILATLNKSTKSNYILLSINNVFSYIINTTSNTSNIILIIEFWVHDITNKITKRFITKILIDDSSRNIKVVDLNIANSLSDEFTPSVEYNTKGIYTNISSTPLLLKPTIDPNLILTDNNILHNNSNNNNYISGIDEIKLDYNEFKPTTSYPISSLLGEIQKTLLPPNILNSIGNPIANFPCRRNSTCWDSNGINFTQPETPICKGINNSPLKKYPYFYDNPSFLKQVTNLDTNYLGLMGSVNTNGASSSLTY